MPLLAAALLLGACSEAETPDQPAPEIKSTSARPVAADLPQGSGFDFYVLALSWSPTYCLHEGRERQDRTQCGDGRSHGFIVHGLWPQFEQRHPEYCPTRLSDRVPDKLIRSLMDLTPSYGLIGHMWRKHGTCSGLSQDDYFTVVRSARERLVMPAAFDAAKSKQTISPQQVETLFSEANPGLTADRMAVTCTGGELREVRICLTTELEFRSCPEVDRSGCRATALFVPPPG
ncbi:ribonuclease T2 family protein [Pseudohoeflea suaedae]|uniref:ribonuclease T2 family protein n=1 Tax=Pseudohoeflea suaedae TaxID=877384 RepID=UPI001FCF0265|nr:ribonuclease T(2) [Pseudohoeflea suaedae]